MASVGAAGPGLLASTNQISRRYYLFVLRVPTSYDVHYYVFDTSYNLFVHIRVYSSSCFVARIMRVQTIIFFIAPVDSEFMTLVFLPSALYNTYIHSRHVSVNAFCSVSQVKSFSCGLLSNDGIAPYELIMYTYVV